MSSLWTDLLFLHGHIGDVRLARRLAVPKPAGAPPAVRPAATTSQLRVPEALSDVREEVSADGYSFSGD